MPEWLIGAVLKTVEHASVPWVRIPLPPNFKPLIGAFLLENKGKYGKSKRYSANR